MTYYRFIQTSTNSRVNQGFDPNSLEGVALEMKKCKTLIDNLSSKYEVMMDEISAIKLKQKDASQRYNELKKQLVELAVDDNTEEEEE